MNCGDMNDVARGQTGAMGRLRIGILASHEDTNALLATNAVYVIPTGEVARAVSRVGIQSPVSKRRNE